MPGREGNPALAVVAGIIGIGIAGVLAYQTIDLLVDLGDVRGDIPGGWTVMIVLHLVVAGLGLLGAILVFVRQVAGAFVLLAAATFAIAVLILDPALAEGVWFTMLGALVLAPVLLIIAALPPSLGWPRGPRPSGYPQYPPRW